MDVFERFWWLLFPLLAFALGGFNRWLAYRRQRDVIALLRMYAEQGKDPPADIAHLAAEPDDWSGGYAPRRYGRHGRYWEWRRAAFFASLAVGFGLASWFTGDYHSHDGFLIATVVMTCLAVGFSLFAVLSPRDDARQ